MIRKVRLSNIYLYIYVSDNYYIEKDRGKWGNKDSKAAIWLIIYDKDTYTNLIQQNFAIDQ